MQSSKTGKLIFIRLFPGEDIYAELNKACRQYRFTTAVVLSGIGQLCDIKLGYFKGKGDYHPEIFEDTHELLSLQGNIARQQEDYVFHLHVVLGNDRKQAIGGHLLQGIVVVTNEIVLMTADIQINRKLEDTTGLQGMYLE